MFYRKHKSIHAPHSDVLMTKQEPKEACDINNILSQYKKTGILAHVTSARPDYTDLPDATDYQNSLNIMMEASDAFNNLPSAVRDHFQNDPYQFLQSFGDSAQHDKLREFGLLKPIADPDGRLPQPPSDAPAAAPASSRGSKAPIAAPDASGGS